MDTKRVKDNDHDDQDQIEPVCKKLRKNANGEKNNGFSTKLNLEEIRQIQEEFVKSRDWEKYHTPRNILLAMVGEVGELSEIFQWRGECQIGLPDWKEKDKEHLGQELSDVLIYLIRLADICHIDLPVAVLDKFKLNKQKYPADLVKGQWRKYNTYDTSEQCKKIIEDKNANKEE